MKKILLIMSLILLCASCSLNNEKRELNVLNWSSYIPQEIIEKFEKETGIDVNYSTYSSNEELLAKLSSSKEGTYDLIFPSDYMVEIMISRDLLEPLDKTKLKNISNLNSKYLNKKYDKGNTYTLPFLAATVVIAYDSKVIKEPITSYDHLLRDEYKNEIVLIEDQRIIIGMALLANGFDMNSTDEEELKLAKEWLKDLKPNIKAYDSDSPKNFLITKEASIGVLWNAEAALAGVENENIKTVFADEGYALSMDNFAIPKGSKNKNELYEFIDYILRADVMKSIVEGYPYKNINSETDKILGDSYKYNTASNVPDEIMDKGIFVENIGSSVKLYDRIWAEIK